MQDYNFWQDVFDTYQSLSIALQLAWLILPPAFVLGLAALILRFWWRCRQLGPVGRGDLVYTIYRKDVGTLDVYRHDAAGDSEILRTENAADDAGGGSGGGERVLRWLE